MFPIGGILLLFLPDEIIQLDSNQMVLLLRLEKMMMDSVMFLIGEV